MTSELNRSFLLRSDSGAPLSDLLYALRGYRTADVCLDRDTAMAIRRCVLQVVGGRYAGRIQQLEDAVLAMPRDRERRNAMTCIVLDRHLSQLGISAWWKLRIGSGQDGEFIVPGARVETTPVTHRLGVGELQDSPPDAGVAALYEAVRIYNQFVIYAVQERPMIVFLALLNQLLRPEAVDGNGASTLSDAEAASDVIGGFTGAAIRRARDLLRLHYMTASGVSEELILLHLGETPVPCDNSGREGRYQRLYHSLGLTGIFNLLSGWLHTGLPGFRDGDLARMLDGFSSVRVGKPDALMRRN